MGRIKGTRCCPKCGRTNPKSTDRQRKGCRGFASHCGYMFPDDFSL